MGFGGRKPGRLRFNSPLFLEFAVPVRGSAVLSASPPRKPSKALCGSVPGYTDSGVKQATIKEGLVSLPDPCSKMADGADLFNWFGLLKLGGIGAGFCFARQASFKRRSRWKGELVALHTDPEIKRKPRCYARLIRDMRLPGLVSFGPPSEATVGVFVVPKKLRETEVNV